MQGSQTSGEVEFVVISNKGQIYISVGSDHNDRTLEELWTSMLGKVFDTAKSKQMVPTIVASEGWLYDDVKGHWNALVLKVLSRNPDERLLIRNLDWKNYSIQIIT